MKTKTDWHHSKDELKKRLRSVWATKEIPSESDIVESLKKAPDLGESVDASVARFRHKPYWEIVPEDSPFDEPWLERFPPEIAIYYLATILWHIIEMDDLADLSLEPSWAELRNYLFKRKNNPDFVRLLSSGERRFLADFFEAILKHSDLEEDAFHDAREAREIASTLDALS
jgi:hypothetical protein